MPRKGHRVGDVRVAPGRRKVEILVIGRNGKEKWIPYMTHLRDVLIACCPNCTHTGTLGDFEAKEG